MPGLQVPLAEPWQARHGVAVHALGRMGPGFEGKLGHMSEDVSEITAAGTP
jgi:hypothetical protein